VFFFFEIAWVLFEMIEKYLQKLELIT